MSGLLDYVGARTVEDGDCLRWTGTVYNGHPGGKIDRKKILIRRALFERAIRASEEPVKVLAERYHIAQATVSKIRLWQVRREVVGNPWAELT